ncbi:SIR2 family protein [Micrococcus luteus]|uniref:P-loop NTPase n=1 Tax=Micrococcus luteus TaxID=1270 RepID=UPI0030190EA6
MSIDISEADWDEFFNGLFRRRYTLLLGAGFSLDVQGADGRKLPSGWDLGRELISEFNLEEDTQQLDTDRLFNLVQGRKNSEGLTRDEWLKSRFLNTRPPRWLSLVVDLGFKIAWTYNIDDALENSIGRNAISRTWQDVNDSHRFDRFAIIHLHGKADDPASIVFSRHQYSQVIRNQRSFSSQFNELISDGPVVVIGASLANESDLADALSRRATLSSGPYPSLIIKPEGLKSYEEIEFKSWNLVHVKATAEQFLKGAKERLPAAQARFAREFGDKEDPSPSIFAFARQWKLLDAMDERVKDGSNVLTGAEPNMNDVERGLSVERGLTNEIVNALQGESSRVLVSGPPFAGKTTIVLQALNKLRKSGWEILEFREEEKLDTNAVLAHLRRRKNSIFYVDRAGLFSAELGDLLSQANERDVPIKLVCVDRDLTTSRLQRWGRFAEVKVPGGVDNTVKLALYNKMKTFGRLNSNWNYLEDKKVEARISRLKNHDFASLVSDFFTGEDLSARVRRDIRELDAWSSKIYFVVALLARPSKGANTSWLARVGGLSGRAFEERLNEVAALRSLIRGREGRYIPANKKHAELFLEATKKDAPGWLMDAFTELCLALAPSLSIDAIKERTRPYRVSQVVMDQETIWSWLGRAQALTFYERMEDAFAWNSRYWEQRALCASRAGLHVEALRFVDFALAQHKDAFVYNTSATIRFKRVLASSLESTFWADVADAIADVDEARGLARPDSEYPFITFFENLYKVVKRSIYLRIDVPDSIPETWKTWRRDAGRSQAFCDDLGRKKLDDITSRWANLMQGLD